MRCSFCGKSFNRSGIMFVKKDGAIYYFDSSKCQNFFLMGKNPKKLKWTEKSKK